MIPFSLAGALFFSAMNSHLGWCVFGAVAGAVISHCVIEVIYHADFKKLFCHEKTMAACMAVSLGLILGFRFDVFRYDSYLPDPGRIISASIDFNKDSWVSWDGGKLYEDGVPRVVQAGAVSDVDALLKIAAEGIRQTEEREAGTWDYQDSSYVTVGYTLKGGKRVFRVYRMSLEPVLAEADRIYGEDGYKKALYPGISLPEEEAAANMVYMDYLQNVKKPEGTKEELAGVTLLGSKQNRYPSDYAPEVLETFENKHPDNDYFVKFNCPEFTSLCPMTGQPDFATIYISYVPGARMVESKSLKLYLFSFRNHGDFHEDCVNIIMKDLIRLMDPKYIEVWGKFTPRGGISIDPYCNYGKPGTRWEQVAFERLTHHDLYPEKVDNR